MAYKEDLETSIREIAHIIHQYETILRESSDNPIAKARASRAIGEQTSFLKDALTRYFILCEKMECNVPNDILQIAFIQGIKLDTSETSNPGGTSPDPVPGDPQIAAIQGIDLHISTTNDSADTSPDPVQGDPQIADSRDIEAGISPTSNPGEASQESVASDPPPQSQNSGGNHLVKQILTALENRVVLITGFIASLITIYYLFAELLFPGTFIYAITVKDSDTRQVIPNAAVTLQVGKNAPLTEPTDVHGAVRFVLDRKLRGQTGTLTISAPGYEEHPQDIDIEDQAEPVVILLTPVKALTETSTNNPTEEPVTEPTVETEEPTTTPTEESTAESTATENSTAAPEPTATEAPVPTVEPTTTAEPIAPPTSITGQVACIGRNGYEAGSRSEEIWLDSCNADQLVQMLRAGADFTDIKQFIIDATGDVPDDKLIQRVQGDLTRIEEVNRNGVGIGYKTSYNWFGDVDDYFPFSQ